MQWPVEGEGGGGISAGGRRLASLLPEYASDMEDWVGRPRRLAWLYVAAEEAPAPVESEPTDYALGLQRFRDLVDALLYLKDRGNAHFKAKAVRAVSSIGWRVYDKTDTTAPPFPDTLADC